ncbi:TlyA family RNA methyltransferase [Sneathiella glossodoripedis]|uniref:TlyA family RNA methyltransferase n=1 Tax=Sneathiella glossodoripedis TaxID=418853 RepID=UPI000ABB0153|nr:TlyA family RNA methyltransferase [Sneathiella glossodoripedis]
MKPVRLDQAIVERKLANSRSRAQALIAEGRITLDGQPAQKASQKVHQSSVIELIGDGPDWVGRGALKLLAALEHFNIDPAQKIAADIGASTGGFSEVLLQHDIKRIYAVDVGRDQLHPRVKADPRVLDLSGLNAKDISPQLIPDPLDLIVCDVSFISLKKALPGVLKLCNRSAILLTDQTTV